ncbi:MAG: aspartate aminotransferase family protein [Rhodospirillales bacterium]|nr:aspartate aminotransferase family protein [Rhodospirillales bacterium]
MLRPGGTNSPAALIPPASPGPVIVAGRGATVTDDGGRTYIDLEAGPGVSSVGHCHPRVVEAIRAQAGRLIHSPGRYMSHLAASLVERLSALTGGRLNRTFFSNSGAEANDGAIKLALKHALLKGKRGFGILSLEHGFHGRLSLPLALTGLAERKKGFGPYGSFPGVVHLPAPYCYRCPLRLDPATCGAACADVVEEKLKTSVPGEAAIMIAEPVLGVGGVIVPPAPYWPKIEAICERHRITLIQDEVFTGFGRTGKMFAHEHFAARPDVMTFAKAIGGGVPLAGFTANEDVGSAFEKGDHFSTFGVNNQLGLAAAHAVLDVLDEEGLVPAAGRKGQRLLAGLRDLAKHHQCIGDVRGLGLMIGVELVHDRVKRTPAPDILARLLQELTARGVLAATTGVHNCVLRITPPLVITEAEIDGVLARLDDSLMAAAI